MPSLDLSLWNAYANVGWGKKTWPIKLKLQSKWNIFSAIHAIYIFPFLPICLPTQVGANFITYLGLNLETSNLFKNERIK